MGKFGLLNYDFLKCSCGANILLGRTCYLPAGEEGTEGSRGTWGGSQLPELCWEVLVSPPGSDASAHAVSVPQ